MQQSLKEIIFQLICTLFTQHVSTLHSDNFYSLTTFRRTVWLNKL